MFLCASAAQAIPIPTYRMEHHFFFSDTVVYCEEKEIRHEKQSEHQESDVVKCTVLQVFKGDIAKGTELEVTYGWDHPRKTMRRTGDFPPGKALLFLSAAPDGKYKLDDARLVQEGKVYRFLQEWSPGGLDLVEEKRPENIVLPEGAAYGEKELLEDAAAVAKTVTATIKNGVKSEVAVTREGALLRIRLTNLRKPNPNLQSEGMVDWYGTDDLLKLGIVVLDAKGAPAQTTEDGKAQLDAALASKYPTRTALKAGESRVWEFALDEIYQLAPGKYTLSSTVSFTSDGRFKLSSGKIGFERTEAGAREAGIVKEILREGPSAVTYDGLNP